MAAAELRNRYGSQASGNVFSRAGMFARRVDDPSLSLAQKARGGQILARLNSRFPQAAPSSTHRSSFAVDPVLPVTSASITEQAGAQTVSAVPADRRSRDNHLRLVTAETEIALREQQVKNELAAYLASHPIPDLVDHAVEMYLLRTEPLGDTPDAIADARAALEKAGKEQQLTPAERAIAEQFLAQQHDSERAWWDRDSDSGRYAGDNWWNANDFLRTFGPEIKIAGTSYDTRTVYNTITAVRNDPDFRGRPQLAAVAAASELAGTKVGISSSGADMNYKPGEAINRIKGRDAASQAAIASGDRKEISKLHNEHCESLDKGPGVEAECKARGDAFYKNVTDLKKPMLEMLNGPGAKKDVKAEGDKPAVKAAAGLGHN